MTFSLTETAIFLALVAASATFFFLRFGPTLKKILTAKRDPSFHLGSLGPRIWKFTSEVLFQSKVISQRPLPGITHAFVFWGFLVFALVSTTDFLEGVRLHLVSRESWFGHFYFGFAAIFAVFVGVSIAYLAFRRFVLRPKALGKLSYESGFIALLIFMLMVSFIATFIPGYENSKPLWWIHVCTILIFLPLIPHTKHLHLILSPFAIFFDRPGFSDIPPLVGDEDFGLNTGKDITQIIALQAYSCVECGRCTEHCPANNTGKELNPKEIALGFRRYLNDQGPHNEQPLLEKYLSKEAAFQCTTCGACEFQCPVGIQHLPMIIGLRRGAVNTGNWDDEQGTNLFINLERNGNALGLSSSEREKFIQKQQFPIFDGTQEYCLWLGCMGAYDPKGREIIASFARVMRYLNVSYGVLQKEKCTGDPARRLGNDLAFGMMAEENLENLRTNNVRKIVSICPHCVRTIQTDWAEYGVSPEIEHHSEFMARYKDKLPTDADTGQKIVYHDPCYLGRYRDVYDQPREIVEQFGTLVEPPRTREKSFCCGAGGGLAFLGEEKGQRVSVNRATELAGTGAQVIGAACPFCNTMFRDALAAMPEGTAPQLLDIAQIAAASLPPQ
jgi:Fe-S oxidoreductase